MRSSFGLTLVLAATFLGVACSSSSSSNSASPGGSGGSGDQGGDGGDSGTGGISAIAGSSDQNGGSAGDDGNAGDTSSPTGGHTATCPQLGSPIFLLEEQFGCGQCIMNSCNDVITSAFGAGWSSGDLTDGGECQSYMVCVTGCQCDVSCVSKNCDISTDCSVVKMAAENCVAQSCPSACHGSSVGGGGAGGAPFDEGGFGGMMQM